ncbi:alpha/beta hydrolase family protein [Candidatus Finniella inopinata]|uniref:Peptidase S9 prolyl oligopeptidase catalytic domain-containing protein n=1 Tax=Candidatus Finniella inopinata TaxID=1696036 RepID=A0A4Q7DQ12_9PROT|nr:prolyl oligopeptidase family serine peptidase [Candidatus Finniella inopinata]RZI47126.1 hypothetical protein EQU50_00655 [Candidatus Finniella inopinata]
MYKYIFGTFFLLAISCDQLFSMVFDKDAEVRAFRAWANWNKPGAHVVKAGQYEGIDILNFIADRGLAGHIPPSLNPLIKGRNPKQYLASVALSMLQGYGFDEGIVDTPVNPSEMTKYRDAVTTIGQHLNKSAKSLAVEEISKTTKTGTHINEHVRIANELLGSKPPLTPVEPLYTMEGFIRSEASMRETFWNGHIASQCSDVKCYTSDKTAAGAAGTFSPLQRVSATGKTQQGHQYNLRSKAAASSQLTKTEIHYNVYISDAVREGREQPKGVIVKIYGGVIKEKALVQTEPSLEYIVAHQGYIVYALNLRGVEGIDPDLLAAQGKSEGVISTLRDVTYFAQMIKRAHRILKEGNNKQTQSAINSPEFSDLIKDQNIPIVLTGGSFGGYMSMLVATYDETFDAVDFKNIDSDDEDSDDVGFAKSEIFSYDHRTTFDAYIPVMGVNDVRGDMNSGTEVSKRRWTPGKLTLLQGMNGWIANAFYNRNILDNDADNNEVSPIYRMNLLERPMLLMHGLSDRNTSPFESIDFINAAFKYGKRDLVAAYFDRDLGHSYPTFYHPMKSFYETIFRFMDLVAWHKKKEIPFKFSPAMQSSTFAAKEAAALVTKARHEDIAEDDQKFILDALKLYKTQKATQPSASGLEEQVWEAIKSSNRLSYIKALLARKAYAVYPNLTFRKRQERDSTKERIFNEIGLTSSPPPSNFLDPNYRDASNKPTGQIVQYYMWTNFWFSPPNLDVSKNVIGLASNAAAFLEYYDNLIKSEFLDIIRNKAYILDNLEETILETNIFFNEKDLPTLDQMIASSVTTQEAPPPIVEIAPPPLVQIASQQVIPSRPIVLGANGAGNIELSCGTLASQLKSLPVDATGKAGRYTIGERTIEPTMLVIKKITEGDCNLSDAELQPFLICVAAALNEELVNPLAKIYSPLKENENINVFKGDDNISYASSGRARVRVSKKDLLNSFKKYCDCLRTGQNPQPEAVDPELLANIVALQKAKTP